MTKNADGTTSLTLVVDGSAATSIVNSAKAQLGSTAGDNGSQIKAGDITYTCTIGADGNFTSVETSMDLTVGTGSSAEQTTSDTTVSNIVFNQTTIQFPGDLDKYQDASTSD
jgi:hypothetical protein